MRTYSGQGLLDMLFGNSSGYDEARQRRDMFMAGNIDSGGVQVNYPTTDSIKTSVIALPFVESLSIPGRIEFIRVNQDEYIIRVGCVEGTQEWWHENFNKILKEYGVADEDRSIVGQLFWQAVTFYNFMIGKVQEHNLGDKESNANI